MIYTDDFEAFYKLYPKTGEKMVGSQRYAKLSQKDRDLAKNDCTKRYAGTENQFIPNVARYILRRYWEEPIQSNSVGVVDKEPVEPVICPECEVREVKLGGSINRCEVCYVPPVNPVLKKQREYYKEHLKPYLCETPKGHTARLRRIAKSNIKGMCEMPAHIK